jgi:superoxide reductase
MATERHEVYKCGVCGIVAEALDGGAGEMVCCGRPMQKMAPSTAETSAEKHVPWVQRVEGGLRVTVGEADAHPMEPKHFIQWIEVLVDGRQYRQYLEPGDKPEAEFPVDGDRIVAREFCNIHGLWRA